MHIWRTLLLPSSSLLCPGLGKERICIVEFMSLCKTHHIRGTIDLPVYFMSICMCVSLNCIFVFVCAYLYLCMRINGIYVLCKTHHIWRTIDHPVHLDLKLETPGRSFSPEIERLCSKLQMQIGLLYHKWDEMYTGLVFQVFFYFCLHLILIKLLAACHQVNVSWMAPTVPETMKQTTLSVQDSLSTQHE